MHMSKLLTNVKQALADHQAKHGKLDDKDYEKWFVHYYLELSEKLSKPIKNHRKNGLN
jgi:hypothetical protein